MQGLVARGPRARREQVRQSAAEPMREFRGRHHITAADIGMRQGCLARQTIGCVRQRFAQVTEQEKAIVGPAGGVDTHLALEDEDVASRQPIAQVIVGPAVAEADLEDGAGQIAYLRGGKVEARPLRFEPTYDAVETTHTNSLGERRNIALCCRAVNSTSEDHMTGATFRCTPRSITILLAAWLLVAATDQGPNLQGQLVQGGLVHGQVAPGAGVWLDDRPLRVGSDGRFVFGLGRDAPATAELIVALPGGGERRQLLQIAPRSYEVQRIDGLPQSMVTPSEADLAQIRADSALIREARARDTEAAGFAEQVTWPTHGRISGVYGSQRILNGEPRSPHRGVDIAAPRGTPVGAMASGVVSLAETGMYFTGGTVMVDHGHGVSSIYVHLEDVRVTVGQHLEQGQTLGTVGATGRATGPHLHWGVNWFDQAVDPALLVGPMPE